MLIERDEILARCVDLVKLVKTDPSQFNFSRLNSYQQAFLLTDNPELFKPHIRVDEMSPSKRADVFMFMKNRADIDDFDFTENELKKLPIYRYMGLLEHNFRKYFLVELFEKLSNRNKFIYFTKHTNFLIKKLPTKLKFTPSTLGELAFIKPKVVAEYVDDLSDQRTNYAFWFNMIKYDKSYASKFLEYIHNFTNKTETRMLFRHYSLTLVSQLTVDVMDRGPLNLKEWAHLLASLIRDAQPRTAELLKSYITEDIINELKLGLSSEILSGESTSTKNLKNSIDLMYNDVL